MVLYEGTNVCMREMYMQIRKSVSASEQRGCIDWELFSIITIIMRNICKETDGMQITLCSCSGNCGGQDRPGLTQNLRGIHEEKQAGDDYVGSSHTRLSRHSTPPPSLLLYHVYNSRTKTFLNICVCVKNAFLFICASFSCFSSSSCCRNTRRGYQTHLPIPVHFTIKNSWYGGE